MQALALSALLVLLLSSGSSQDVCPEDCECEDTNGFAVTCVYADLRIVPSVPQASRVQSLDLSNNLFTTLQKQQLEPFTALESLRLSDNDIDLIDTDAFTPLKRVRNIDLSCNNLHHINPKLFLENSVLETVNLRGNPLVYIPSNSPFIFSQSLVCLDLSLCKLTSLGPLTFSQVPNVRVLDLSWNLLREVRKDALEILPELSSLDLRNNMWNCDCQVVDILRRVTRNRRSLGLPVDSAPVKCLDGSRYRTLWSVASENLTCDLSVLPLVREDDSVKVEATLDQEESGAPETKERRLKSPTEQSWWEELFSWNVNTVLVFIVLPLTLGVAIFVTLIAVNSLTRRMNLEHNSPTVPRYRFSEVPLMKPHAGSNVSLESGAYVTGNSYHIYERIN